MCGLAGYLGPSPPDSRRVAACLELMKRRGPDHQEARHWLTPDGRHLSLLHARLSIIDLAEHASQPFRVGRRWIVFNGELYNYLELRRLLAAEGRAFATDSDTEVLLTALDQWGPAALDRCEGMWAFAAYDEQSGELMLARDRFGEKPLHLYRALDGGLYFASEAKFLACLAGRRFAANGRQLRRFLVNGYKSLYKTADTFLEGVRELPRAHTLVLRPGGSTEEAPYWRFEHRPEPAMSYAEAVAGARERLVRAVELRLRSDVPLAFCLSGGIDSNALAGIARNVFGYDVHGFTIVNDDERYDETALVDLVVGRQRLRHTAVPVQTDDFVARLRTLVRQHDAPVYTISYYAQWLLHQAMAEQGYHIAVSGTGADELFTGYYDHHAWYLQAVRDDPALFAEAEANWLAHIKPIVRNPVLQNPRVFVDDPGERRHIYLDNDRYRGFLVEDWAEAFEEESFTAEPLRNRMLNEMFHEVVPQILHEDDLNAMYYSIENRSPFLDRPLFEFCLRLPARHLVQGGRAKAVLRDAMRGLVPDEVLDCRRKIGFNADVLSFLDPADPEVRGWLMADSPLWQMVRRERVAELIAQPQLGNGDSKFLFCVVSAKMFLDEIGQPGDS